MNIIHINELPLSTICSTGDTLVHSGTHFMLFQSVVSIQDLDLQIKKIK